MVNIDTRGYITPQAKAKRNAKVERVSKLKVDPKEMSTRQGHKPLKDRREGDDRRKKTGGREDLFDMRTNNGRRETDQRYPKIEIDI